MRKSVCNLTVRGYELDSFGHVNNAVYLNYAENAVWNFFHSIDLMDATLGSGLFPVVLKSTQRYMHELRLFDEVRIESEFSCSNGLLKYKHLIINESTGLTSCKVTGKIAFVNKEHMICDIPDEVLRYLEGDEDEH